MVRRFVRLLAFLVIAAVFPGFAYGQSGQLTGVVRDSTTMKPLSGATIRVLLPGDQAVTTTSGEGGTWRLGALTAGEYTVEVLRLGYAKRQVSARVTGGSVTTVDVVLHELATKLNRIVTTATRGAVSERLLDVAATISVVSSDQISTRPATLPTDYLRTLPGVSVSSAGIGHSNTVARGFNNAFSSAMLGLQDYRFSGLPSLRANLPLLNTGTMEDIERIEVLNGPAAALYGPNAANGVLHVITKSALRSPGTTLTLDAGGRSIVRLAGRRATAFGSLRDWGAKVSGEYFSGVDWPDRDPNLPAVYPPTAPAGRAGRPLERGTAVRRANGELRLDYERAGGTLQNTFTAGYTRIFRSNEVTSAFGPTQGRNWTYTSLQERMRYKRFFAQLFYNKSNSGSESLSDTDGSYYLTTGIPIVDQSSVWAAQVQQGFDLFGASFIAGLDYVATFPTSKGSVYGRYETTSRFGNTDVTERGAYLQGTLPIGTRFKLVGAVRGDQTNRLDGSQVSPSGTLLYTPNATSTLRATVSRAFNSPVAFQYFLDQVANPFQAPGMPLRIVGNPPKQGWQFNRSCTQAVQGGLCMYSPWVPQGPGTIVPSSAAAAFPGFVAAFPAIVNALPTLTPAAKAQLNALLQQLAPILGVLRPTDAQVGSYLLRNGVESPANIRDIEPLRPSYNVNYELGYKGIVRNRLFVAANAWYQERGDIGSLAAQANPLVMFDPTSLGTYLTTSITQGLVAAGQSPAQAQAAAAQAAAALVPLMAAFPQGSLAFTGALNSDPSIIVTYLHGSGKVYVHGLDLALDYQAAPEWVVSGSWSYQNRIVFPQIGGAANPLMSNTPKHRGSASVRYAPDAGFGMDGAIRHSGPFPVNSGYYNTLVPNAFNAQFQSYDAVPASTQLDLGVSYRFRPSKVTLAVNATNVLNHEVPTFAGTPRIGRLILTRLRYEF